MIEILTSAFAGTILETFLKWLGERIRFRQLTKSRDEAIIGRDLAEQRQSELEARLKIHKDMADAQTRAPHDRGALADRLRAEAAAEADNAGPGLPLVEGRGDGPQG
jgi:hypothetical protein